jgi:hypothetical protein
MEDIMKAIIACAGVAGCMLECNSPGDTYTLYIDPAFTVAQQADILQAADNWQNVVPVRISPIVGACPGLQDKVICIAAAGLSPNDYNGITSVRCGVGSSSHETGGWMGVDGGKITIYLQTMNSDGDLLPQVASHEMGHAMGLEHWTGNILMNARYEQNVQRPVCQDVEQWYQVRGHRYLCN